MSERHLFQKVCEWPKCLTNEQHRLLGESIERENMGLEPLPEHLDLHCHRWANQCRWDPRCGSHAR